MLRGLTRPAAAALSALALLAWPLLAGAQAFSPPVNVSQSSNGSQVPSLVVDALGTPRVFWHDFTSAPNLLWCSSHDGAAWAPGAACAPNVTQSWSPRAAADAFGGVHLAWRDRTAGNDEILYSSWDGAGWSSPVNLSQTADPSGNPAIAVDAAGHPHVAWEEGPAGAKAFFETWFDGVAWAPARDSGLPFVQAAALDTLRLAFAPDGTLHAAWHDGVTSLTEIFHAELAPGAATWGPVENVSDTPSSLSAEPALGCAPDGTLHIAWIEQDPALAGVFETCLASRPPGGAWGPKADISRQGTWCYRPSLAVGIDGVPRIAWHADTATGKEVFFVSRPSDAAVDVSASPGSDSARVAVALDGADAAWLAWTEGVTNTAEIHASTTAVPGGGPVLLRVAKDEAAGDVLLSWTGGAAPWQVLAGTAPDPAGPTWADISAPAGALAPAWTEAGTLRDGTSRFFLVN